MEPGQKRKEDEAANNIGRELFLRADEDDQTSERMMEDIDEEEDEEDESQ